VTERAREGRDGRRGAGKAEYEKASAKERHMGAGCGIRVAMTGCMNRHRGAWNGRSMVTDRSRISQENGVKAGWLAQR